MSETNVSYLVMSVVYFSWGIIPLWPCTFPHTPVSTNVCERWVGKGENFLSFFVENGEETQTSLLRIKNKGQKLQVQGKKNFKSYPEMDFWALYHESPCSIYIFVFWGFVFLLFLLMSLHLVNDRTNVIIANCLSSLHSFL